MIYRASYVATGSMLDIPVACCLVFYSKDLVCRIMTMRKYIVNLLLLAFSIHLGVENVRVIENFDYDWLFGRYGLQADGSRIEVPLAVEDVSFEDSCWRQLDLPHDWAVEGPFRTDLEGFTGKLPWRGIGWYRKHFKVNKADTGKRFYLDFDGAIALPRYV